MRRDPFGSDFALHIVPPDHPKNRLDAHLRHFGIGGGGRDLQQVLTRVERSGCNRRDGAGMADDHFGTALGQFKGHLLGNRLAAAVIIYLYVDILPEQLSIRQTLKCCSDAHLVLDSNRKAGSDHGTCNGDRYRVFRSRPCGKSTG